MKYKYLYPFLSALLVAGCAPLAEPPIEDTSVPIGKKVEPFAIEHRTIGNELLQVTTLPGAMGGIENITLRDGNRPLLWGAEYQRTNYGALFEQKLIKGNIFIELFWDGSLSANLVPVKTVRHRPDMVEFFAEYYGDTQLSLKREISLEPQCSVINIKATAVNRAQTPQKLRPWLDILPRTGEMRRILPVLGNVQQTVLGGAEIMPQTGVYSPTGDLNNFLAPARPWIAARLEKEDVILVLQLEAQDVKQCAVYFWNGALWLKPAHTVEFILNECVLPVGGSFSYRYRIGIFTGMKDLVECVGDYGIDLAVEGKVLTLTLGVLRPTTSEQIAVEITDKQGKTFALPAQMSGKLFPGKASSLRFALPDGVDGTACTFTVVIGKEKYPLLERVDLKSKK